MAYLPAENRYDEMIYNRCGRSGLLLPAISLGLWHNFGEDKSAATAREICRTAFDLGITHFDLANNYGPPPGSAETLFGETHQAMNRSAEANRAWQAARGAWPSNTELTPQQQADLALLELRLGRRDQANRIAERLQAMGYRQPAYLNALKIGDRS